MTCIDKLREIKPGWNEARISEAVRNDCPEDWHIVHDGGSCPRGLLGHCKECWDREIDIVEDFKE